MAFIFSHSYAFGNEGKHQGIEADTLLLGEHSKFGVKAFRHALYKFAGHRWFSFRHAVRWSGDFSSHIRLRGNPGKKSVPAVMDRIFDSLPIGHASGKIGKGDKKTTAVIRGKRTNDMGVCLEGMRRRDGLDFFDIHFSSSFTASMSIFAISLSALLIGYMILNIISLSRSNLTS
ncbi:MAG: hypothetical protein A2V87_07130 [Deltaproteobacteria bacterium RBG_16_58_17]|nr:MAG: hypothetical protein A2V87_07130 [Deltaproteobacteria bacterium RBG_16_58_17]